MRGNFTFSSVPITLEKRTYSIPYPLFLMTIKNIVMPRDPWKSNAPLPQEALHSLRCSMKKGLYQHARAFVFAGVEDFGISFVEAQACGVPILAYKRGGILDIVDREESGILFENQSVEDIVQTINLFNEREKDEARKFDPSTIRKNSLRFSVDNFNRKIKDYFQGRQ